MVVARRYHTEVYQGRTHVVPTDDEMDHAISEECNCAPRVENHDTVGVFVFHQLVREIPHG